MNGKDCTIIVNSCDSYEDAWYPFFCLFKKYWSECPYDIVLNTESKSFQYDGLNIKCLQYYNAEERPPYGERLLKCLNTIKTPVILVLLDDFFLRKQVDMSRIEYYVQQILEHADIACFSFDSTKDVYNIDDGIYSDFLLRPQCGEYKVNLQGGVWNKHIFAGFVRSHDSPWELETKGSIRSFNSPYRFYTLRSLDMTPIDYGKKPGLTWGIVRGKWVRDDIEPLFECNGIPVDLEARGFFDRNNYIDITKSDRTSQFDSIRSYGFMLWLDITRFCVLHKFRKILKLHNDQDYVAYRRRRMKK